jgi:inorganic pyrophosphatase
MKPRNVLHRRLGNAGYRTALTAVAIVLTWFCAEGAQHASRDLRELPAPATKGLESSLKAARAHARHIWRDTPPTNPDGTVNAYVEIARGDRRKWEFDMGANERAIDRVIPEDIGGYPVNYGFVPQTVSYDGDPFDALVLGPALAGGSLVRGIVVGLMYMEDEKGSDSKVVLSPVAEGGGPRVELTPEDRERIAGYFRIYKRAEPGAFSRVPGWGSVDDGRGHVAIAHAFFRECRGRAGLVCRVDR